MNAMPRRTFLRRISGGFLAAVGTGVYNLKATAAPNSLAAMDAPGRRPNIILIMSDDMGYSDIGCYGSEIETPNLDALAANGLRFTQFYNTARCCPTRASLLTGLYPHQAGIGHMMEDRKLAGYRGDLNPNCLTIAEVLKLAGYRTYMTGKWHVTPCRRDQLSKHNWPCQRGFDRFFGTIHGAGSFYDPNTLTRDNEFIVPDEDFYYTDAISDNAVRFLQDHHNSDGDRPFFLYVAYTAAHWPLHALPKDIAKYRGKYDQGWDALRRQRLERMVELGLVDAKWRLSERDESVPAWQDARRKDWHARRMEVYAAMIDNMDQGIGRIVKTL
ncbi:MAG: sulfatase-like hydrolase/transferase, partial [Sedimentisphaerales bacterium]|nr:sulfatase-like hydrolase/transferase [Sedimentisphaerales bacterium]